MEAPLLTLTSGIIMGCGKWMRSLFKIWLNKHARWFLMLAEIGFCWWVSCWHKCLMKFDDIWYDWFLVSTIFVNLFAGSFGLFLIFFLNVVEHLVALRSGGSSLQIWPRPTQWSPRRGWIKGCNICGQGLLMIPLGSHGWMVGSWRMCIDGVAYEDTHTQTHTYIYKNIHMFPFQGHIISYHIIIYIYIFTWFWMTWRMRTLCI